MTKKTSLIVWIVGTFIFLAAMYPINFGICGVDSYDCRKTADVLQMLFGIFPVALLFSLITYKMREEVFQSWWKFTRWFVSVIILVTYFLESHSGGGDFGGVVAEAFNFAILFILYSLFVIISIIRIWLAHRKTQQS